MKMNLKFINTISSAVEGYLRPSTVVGIDIGCATLKVVGMRLGAAPLILFRSVIDIHSDKSEGRIAEDIRRVLSENNCTAKTAALVIANDAIVVRRIELPVMPIEDIPNAIKWQIKDSLHYDPEQAVIDFEFIRQLERDDGSKATEIMAVAAPRKEIDRSINILKQAGLETVWVGVAPFAMEDTVRLYDTAEAPLTFLVIDIGCSKSEISIFNDRRLEFVRSIQTGSSAISESMVGTLAGDKGPVSVTKDQAEMIMRSVGIPCEGDECDCTELSATQIISMIRPAVENISTEITRSINYYASEYSGSKVQAVYLTGGGSGLKNLVKFITDEISIPASKLALPKSVAQATPVDPDTGSAIACSVGAALGFRSRPNLLPYEYKVQKLEFAEKMAFRALVFVLGVILALSFVFEKKQLDSYNQRLAHVQFQRDFLRQIKEVHDTVAERYNLLRQLEASEPRSIGKSLSYLRSTIPSSMVLKWLRADLGNRMIDMGGIIDSPGQDPDTVLTRFMEDLERSKYFKDAQLISSSELITDNRRAKEFEISCSID